MTEATLPHAGPEKVSSQALMQRFSALDERLEQLGRLLQLGYNPQPVYFYHPNKSGSGTAARFDQRLDFLIHPKGYTQGTEAGKGVEGGVFLELAQQLPGQQRFDWEKPLRAKLGLNDISALLGAIRCRWARIAPEQIFNKGDGKLELFHKNEAGSTVIGYQVQADGSYLSISKSATERRSIKLTLVEELQLEAYLDEAVRAFLRAGKR